MGNWTCFDLYLVCNSWFLFSSHRYIIRNSLTSSNYNKKSIFGSHIDQRVKEKISEEDLENWGESWPSRGTKWGILLKQMLGCMREKYFLRLHIILYINKQTNELTKNKEVVRDRVKSGFVTEQMGGGSWYIITEKIPPFCLWRFPPTHTHLLGSKCPPPEERRLSMPETGEKERNYLFKSYTDLE